MKPLAIEHLHHYSPTMEHCGVTVRISLSPDDWRELRHNGIERGDLSADPDMYGHGIDIVQERWVPDGVMAIEDHNANIRLMRIHRR